jgi:hypothetical protein
MPLVSGSTQSVISRNIGELDNKFKRTGKIGTSRPANAQKAHSQEIAIALDKAGKSKY